ncbi:MAG: hypothetical protein ACYDCC_07665 [Actinomycetota bacterium]
MRRARGLVLLLILLLVLGGDSAVLASRHGSTYTLKLAQGQIDSYRLMINIDRTTNDKKSSVVDRQSRAATRSRLIDEQDDHR